MLIKIFMYGFIIYFHEQNFNEIPRKKYHETERCRIQDDNYKLIPSQTYIIRQNVQAN